MLLEFMGLQLPGVSFETPDSCLREPLTKSATYQAIKMAEQSILIGQLIDERFVVNAMVGLQATRGSTNHTLHLLAIAAAAGISITWEDFSKLEQAVPLIARVYPNGHADVNEYHKAGGISFTIAVLPNTGLLHEEVTTILGSAQC